MNRTEVKGAGGKAREVTGADRGGPCSDGMVAPKIYVYALIPGICEGSLIWQMVNSTSYGKKYD